MDWKEARDRLLEDEDRRREYERVDLAYEIGNMVIEARIARRMTQAALAERLGTRQPSIARIEKGGFLPSLSFLERIAQALDTQLLPPRFEFMKDISPSVEPQQSETVAFEMHWHSVQQGVATLVAAAPIASSTQLTSITSGQGVIYV